MTAFVPFFFWECNWERRF